MHQLVDESQHSLVRPFGKSERVCNTSGELNQGFSSRRGPMETPQTSTKDLTSGPGTPSEVQLSSEAPPSSKEADSPGAVSWAVCKLYPVADPDRLKWEYRHR